MIIHVISHVINHVISHVTTLASEKRSLRVLSDSPDTPLTISVAASRMRGRPISCREWVGGSERSVGGQGRVRQV